MEFKIDTKTNYTEIKPSAGDLSVNMAEAIRQKVEEAMKSGGHNFVIDLQHMTNMEMASGNVLLDLHNEVYQNGGSIVFCALDEQVTQTMKKGQYHLTLNLCPTLVEAADIISMEVLERDLLGEP